MADLEVRKHAKEALNIMLEKDKGLFHKIKDFLLEIFIIVFAVSLSIWLHGLSEKHHKKEEVKEFLIDLKVDLASDKEKLIAYKEELKQTLDKEADKKIDSIKEPDGVDLKKLNDLESSVVIKMINRNTNSGNYEGFKSSGNINNINNKPIKVKILKYYEQDVKNVEKLEATYNKQMEKVTDMVLSNNSNGILGSNNFLLNTLKKSVIKEYDKLIMDIDSITIEINKEYHK